MTTTTTPASFAVLALAPLFVLFSAVASFAQGPNTPRSQLLSYGQEVFEGTCTGCHEWEGVGSPGGTPPLRNSDFFMAIRLRPVSILLEGYSGPITVNGLDFNGNMPSFGDLPDYDIAALVTYIRAVLNDSTVVSCDAGDIDEETGFAACVKTPRDPSQIANDSVAVWEVTNVREGFTRLAGRAHASAPASRSFRVTGAGSYVFAVPSGFSGKAVLRVVDAWGRTVWSAPVDASGRAGDRAVRWNGAATNGRRVAPGLYVARFEGLGAGR